MPFGDLGALSFFGIHNDTSESEGRVSFNISVGESSFKTTYYLNGVIVGNSESKGRIAPYTGKVSYNTTYYGYDGEIIGNSESKGYVCPHNPDYPYYTSCSCDASYKTTYYAYDGKIIGNSESKGDVRPYSSESSFETTYYFDVDRVGTSKSSGYVDKNGIGKATYKTTYDIPQQIAERAACELRERIEREKIQEQERERDKRERAERERIQDCERAERKRIQEREARERYERDKSAREAREKAERQKAYKTAVDKRVEKALQISVARKRVEIPQLKTYYLSKACFFKNAGHKIFNCDNRYVVLGRLESRSRENPGGASDKTLIHFGLK